AGVERAADVQARRGAEDDAGGIDEIEIGCAEAGGLDRSPDVRGIPARDPAEDVARGERRLVQEVRDVVGGETELAETMEEIGAVAWPCAAGDVIIGL